VLVLHACGLDPFFREFCDRLTTKGLVVLAPDLYHGATRPQFKKRTSSDLNSSERPLQKRSQSGRAPLLVLRHGPARDRPRRLFVGRPLALWLAEQTSIRVAATVVSTPHDMVITLPVRRHSVSSGETDDFVAASESRNSKRPQAAGKEAEFYTYPGTTHWFFENIARTRTIPRPQSWPGTGRSGFSKRYVR